MGQGDWITVATLGTFGGVVFAVTIISQFLKGAMDRVVKTRTRLLVLAISWVVLLGRRYVMDGALGLDTVFLDFLNGFLVALAAMGAHSIARDNFNWK
ncbi:MAG TPA: hypothetical protein VD969_05380 [Symbiobacteriaceae bacterium]|nr:hypothetical protein [Symbiobacteriaceae bacterium]